MLRKTLAITVLLSAISLVAPDTHSIGMAKENANDYTIVLVHGFMGWGRDELSTNLGRVPYWGGVVTDLEARLKEDGFTVLTASMGPFSSNWDRACELYAQIANTPDVDYGKVHAARHQHDRFKENKYYRENDPYHLGKQNKIHIIAHSMGTSTARMLIHLLEKGCPDEMDKKVSGGYDDISPLFDAAQDTSGIVHSLTSLSGVNNGTTLANIAVDLVSMIQQIVVAIGATMNGFPCNDPLYNFDVEQFGIVREEGESIADYFEKVKSSSIWESEDVCLYDLKPTGMFEINGWVDTHENVYYFSYSTLQTFANPFLWPHHHLPTLHMAPYLAPFACFMGRYSAELDYGIVIDKSWWPNDGVVNLKSQKYPLAEMNANETKTPVEGLVLKPEKGRWYHIETLNADHMDVVGLGFDLTSRFGRKESLYNFYRNHMEMLMDMP